MSAIITRHFATIAVPGAQPRQVHYRKAGSGPPVLLLHQSPVSSSEYAHLMGQWASDFTLIAPDTPGFGLSDALPGDEPIIQPYAAAVAEFLDAIGVQKCGVYGTHTGAMIAAEFARAYPHRCEVCVLNGYVVATDAEKADVMARYFVPLQPVADGSHMTWAWVRMRDQMIFYPWYRKSAATRMTFDIPGPEFLHPFTMDYFRSANAGLRAYKAAFTYDAPAGLKAMTAPCYAMAFQQDVLFEHLARIPTDIPTCIKLEGHPTPAAVENRARDIFRNHCQSAAPGHTATATLETRTWQSLATADKTQLYVRRSHMGSGRPLVLIHDTGKSSRQWSLLMQMLHGLKPTIAFDLPGHGESGSSTEYNVGAMAQAIQLALAELGTEEVDVVATGAGSAVALVLAQHGNIKTLTLIDPWNFEPAFAAQMGERFTPDLSPTWYGGHLAEAWAIARDSELFWPWFEPLQANSIKTRPELDPWAIHAAALDILKAYPAQRAFTVSAAGFDVAKALASTRCEVTFAAVSNGPREAQTKQLAALMPSRRLISLSDDPSRYAAALAALFRP